MADHAGRGRGLQGTSTRVRGRSDPVEVDGQRDQRFHDLHDIEIEEQRRRIQELEKQLAEARLSARFEEESEDSEDGFEKFCREEDDDYNPFADQGRIQRQGWTSQIPSTNLSMKIDILEFEGNAHPDELIGWFHMIERVSDLKDFYKDQKVKLVAIKLMKKASIWWEYVKRQRAR